MVSLKDVTRERVMVTEICGPVQKKKKKKMSPCNDVMLMVIKKVIKHV